MLNYARLAVAAAALATWLAPVAARARQGEITVGEAQAEYDFGRRMIFKLSAQSPAGISGAALFVETGADDRVAVTEADFSPGPRVALSVVRDLEREPVRPFSRVTYWWRIEDGSGAQLTTERASLVYEDNRFEWQAVERGPVTAHWYDGDLAFGQAAADSGALALPQISANLGATPLARVDVYIYSKVDDLQAGLELHGRTWVAGHADPDLGVVLIAVPPDSEAVLGFERDLPHELTHVLIYQITTPNYHAVPFWLNEGLAVLHETQPNPVYRVTLDRAYQADELLPLTSLCGGFPLDSAEATLAYAQSRSVVSYVRDRWGQAKIVEMLDAYGDGATCEGGTQRALGVSLAALESDWRRDALQADPLRTLAFAVGPWLLLLLLPSLVLFGLLLFPRRRPAAP
jgi:hypothetical protein